MVADEDSKERIYYSMAATFFGRMCLSGDIYDLNETQWQLVEEGIAFYNRVSDIIRDGMTVRCDYSTTQYNEPIGSQLVIRRLKKRNLAIYHRFSDSEPVDGTFLNGHTVLAEYGEAQQDFSAKAWLYID